MFSRWTTCCWWSAYWQSGDPATLAPDTTWPCASATVKGVKEGAVCPPHEPGIGRGRTSRTQASPPNQVRPVVTEKRGRI